MRHTANVDYEIEQKGVAKHLLHNLMATQNFKKSTIILSWYPTKSFSHKSN